MNKFCQILSEIWEEWTKDPSQVYYVTTSRETMKAINLELAHCGYCPTFIFKGQEIQLRIFRGTQTTALRGLTMEFFYTPCLLVKEGKFIIETTVRCPLTFVRDDNLPKGIVSLKRKHAEDYFLD